MIFYFSLPTKQGSQDLANNGLMIDAPRTLNASKHGDPRSVTGANPSS
jgi:hypothetical protein